MTKQIRNDQTPIINELIIRRQSTGVKRARRKPTTQWLFPVPVSRAYQNILVLHVENMAEATINILLRHLKTIEAERDRDFGIPERLDAFDDSIDQLGSTLKLTITGIPFVKKAVADAAGERTNAWNDRQYRKTVRNVFGVDIFPSEPFLVPTLNSFSKENVSLITKMEADYLAEISEVTQRGFRQGATSKQIAQQIVGDGKLFKELQLGAPGVPVKGRDIVTKTKNRAKLIARDQVSKLNGQLTGLRQKNIGIEKYPWRTSQDERVRPSHIANNGKVFSWDSPPPATGHPGEDVQCRCHAEPIFDPVIEAVLNG